jgi:hypothetical protein
MVAYLLSALYLLSPGDPGDCSYQVAAEYYVAFHQLYYEEKRHRPDSVEVNFFSRCNGRLFGYEFIYVSGMVIHGGVDYQLAFRIGHDPNDYDSSEWPGYRIKEMQGFDREEERGGGPWDSWEAGIYVEVTDLKGYSKAVMDSLVVNTIMIVGNNAGADHSCSLRAHSFSWTDDMELGGGFTGEARLKCPAFEEPLPRWRYELPRKGILRVQRME